MTARELKELIEGLPQEDVPVLFVNRDFGKQQFLLIGDLYFDIGEPVEKGSYTGIRYVELPTNYEYDD